jgi:hypothetical protein
MAMKRFSIALGIAVGLVAFAACDGRSPTSPNAVPPTAPLAIYSLGGLVTEPVNVPVEGATVTVLDGAAKGTSSITDPGGGYSLTGVEGTFTVQITKDGYTSATRQVTVPQTISAHFEIMPLTPQANISGAWTVTFEPHRTCPDLPKADFRKYRASIVQHGAQLEVTLSGATFATPPQLAGTIHGTTMSLVLPGGCTYYRYCYSGFQAPPVLESIAANQFLAISGLVTATAGRASLAGTLNGEFTLTKNATPPFDVLTTCSNEQHPVTFTK